MTYEIEKWFKTLNYRLTEEELKKSLVFFSDERTEIRNQFRKLSWHASIDEQKRAIDYLSNNLSPEEYIYLILAKEFTLEPCTDNLAFVWSGGKSMWENAAKTIIRLGWPKVGHIIVPMFMWLVDPNWPGREMIYEFLLSIPKDILCKKMKEVEANPNNYSSHDYIDLMEVFEDFYEDLANTGDGSMCSKSSD